MVQPLHTHIWNIEIHTWLKNIHHHLWALVPTLQVTFSAVIKAKPFLPFCSHCNIHPWLIWVSEWVNAGIYTYFRQVILTVSRLTVRMIFSHVFYIPGWRWATWPCTKLQCRDICMMCYPYHCILWGQLNSSTVHGSRWRWSMWWSRTLTSNN